MRRRIFTIGMLAVLVSSMQSCQQDVIPAPSLQTNVTVTSKLQAAFAKSLGQVLKEDVELRQYIREESLKMFDKDYDILYHKIKDVAINGRETIHERLAHYITEEELNEIEHQLPLLTIYVPTLPSGFSPETWQPDQQIPSIAVRNIGDNNVPIFDENGNKTIIKPGYVPGFPVLVIKQNERVVTAANADPDIRPFYSNEEFSFRFTDPTYDGISNKITSMLSGSSNGESSTRQNRTTYLPGASIYTPNPIARRAYTAYEINVANPSLDWWQRDYIYYGITPTTSKGPLRTNFRETLSTIKLTVNGINHMSGNDGDPGAPNVDATHLQIGNSVPLGGPGIWTDGAYEFLLYVTTNSKDGSPSPRPFRFSARPTDLYRINYTTTRRFGLNVYIYQITSITPIEYHSNISIGTWDLTNFGTTWNYHIYEENQTVDRTERNTIQTTYAVNFEFDPTFSGYVKGGAKFGVSGSRVETTEITLHYITGSTDLGEQVLNFYDPVIVSSFNDILPGSGPYTLLQTYDLSTGGTGGYINMSVEPRSIVPAENLLP